MLKSLYIKNIALISKLSIDFSQKINIFSGETGAGKSIIIDSLNFMLGAKADKTLIRSGENTAVVEGVFDIGEKVDIRNKLEDFNIDVEDDVIISRSMTVLGKSEIRINGKVVTLSMLREISSKLVDVHGQSEHFSLNKVSTHIDLLDKFGKITIESIKNEYKKEWNNYQSIIEELNSFGGNESERARLIDLYSYQISEIEQFDLKDGEEEELNTKFYMISNVEKLANNINLSIMRLEGDEGAITALVDTQSYINNISNIDNKYAQLLDRIKSTRLEIEDVAETLSQSLNDLNFDDREADRIADRLEKIKGLKRKYGRDYEEIQKYLNKTRVEYDKLVNATERIEQLLDLKKDSLEQLKIVGNKLTKERKEQGKCFSKSIVAELASLGMDNATFTVDFKEDSFENLMGSNGADSVEFMFSANLGEPLKPLIKVISGGEMSRFMLGLKSITASLDNIDTLVFDEIDSGISGKIAHVVGEKFIKLGSNRQVIVITHLPQIAAIGDNNFLITKGVVEEHTESKITLLNKDGKIREVARLSGAKELTQNVIDSAIELISIYKD